MSPTDAGTFLTCVSILYDAFTTNHLIYISETALSPFRDVTLYSCFQSYVGFT